MKKKCIVMLSGGLDSRLAVKIMQEQDFEVLALFFKLPYGTGCCDENCSFNFSQLQGVELKIFDCTKGELLQRYLEVIKNPKYGRGAGFNPCKDCKIFIFEKAREFADENGIDLIVSGDVLGERPMSQMKSGIDLVEEKSGLRGRLLRPLSAKLLYETNAEKRGLVDRSKLYDIQGRKRGKQIALAKKFNIKYPTPGGGCLLCEKTLMKRFGTLVKRGIKDNEIHLVGIGRHFLIDDMWVVIGRNEKENKIIEVIGKKVGEVIIPSMPGPSAVIIGAKAPEVLEIVNELIKSYSKDGSLEDRKKFEKWKL